MERMWERRVSELLSTPNTWISRQKNAVLIDFWFNQPCPEIEVLNTNFCISQISQKLSKDALLSFLTMLKSAAPQVSPPLFWWELKTYEYLSIHHLHPFPPPPNQCWLLAPLLKTSQWHLFFLSGPAGSWMLQEKCLWLFLRWRYWTREGLCVWEAVAGLVWARLGRPRNSPKLRQLGESSKQTSCRWGLNLLACDAEFHCWPAS